MEVIEVNHGIANRFSDRIEVNKYLKKYPELYNPIMQHELGHTDATFSWHDFKHDISSEYKVPTFKLIKFMFRHPRTFTQILPIWYHKTKGIIFDINLFIIWTFFLSVIGACILLAVYI